LRVQLPVTAAGESCFARARIILSGTVQGAGMRPFIYRLATGLGLKGWVRNSPVGVCAEVEGLRDCINELLMRIAAEQPSAAHIGGVEATFLEPVGYASFEIRASLSGSKSAAIMPDLATCADCVRELFDPFNRRYRYPFINCTQCGPRFSIVQAIPYDRCNTTMHGFSLCGACRDEYENANDRRFHAQPIACPNCGPQVSLCDAHGKCIAARDDALMRAADLIRRGQIIALKGLGGFQLLADARSEASVQRLRARKRRDEKPFAVMFPTLDSIIADCVVSEAEVQWLSTPQAPIVLLRRQEPHSPQRVAANVAPRNPNLGAMLPYTPLHHLLMRELQCVIVCTSGNRSSEPICIDDDEAFERLNDIADAFLTHNRPIARPIDDSVLRVVLGRELVIRRARGFAPSPISVEGLRPDALAVGAQMKNTIAISVGGAAVLSQYLGDLGTLDADNSFERGVRDLCRIYDSTPDRFMRDAHPDYDSTRFAKRQTQPSVAVQHHYAHVLSCMAENALQPPILGIAWDGTGFGLDGTIWGGEFLRVDRRGFKRVAHLRTFGLPGGERAVEEPRRAALGLLFEIFGSAAFEQQHIPSISAFSQVELEALRIMLARSVNTPRTSSAGRLCDGLASILGLRQRASFEGQAAIELEFAMGSVTTNQAYEVDLSEGGSDRPLVLDWARMVEGVLADRASGVTVEEIAARIHNSMVESIVCIARRVQVECVALSGGCFQNNYLTERTVQRLRKEGFRPYWHRQVPPNDGGIALGQLVAAAREME